MTDNEKRLEELRDKTFSEWMPTDKYWLLTLIDEQREEIKGVNAEADDVHERLILAHHELTAKDAEIERLSAIMSTCAYCGMFLTL